MIPNDVGLRSGTQTWHGMDRATLDRAYDNSGAVANSSRYLADWSERSAALREQDGHILDLAYGPGERNRVDVFCSGLRGAPLLVFIHGGYWQRNSKEVFSCMAAGPLASGLDVALVGYTLAPQAGLDQIVKEVRAALAFLRSDRVGPDLGKDKLIVSGWSAGAHLAASVMDMTEVDAGLAISGIFDLEPIRLGSLNDKLGLTASASHALSPIHHIPQRAGELTLAFGTSELPELQRQSRDYGSAWQDAGCIGHQLALEGADHFSILEQLARPDGLLAKEAARLSGRP